MNTNVKTPEQIIRPIFSIVIAVAVLLLPQLPPWLALVAFYAAFSAMRNRQQPGGIPHRVSHGVSG